MLSLVFFTYPVAAILAHPDWATVGTQTVIPHLLASKDFVLLGVALIGTTITPYMQLYVAAGVADRGVGPEDYRYARLDAVGGAIFADIISMFIIIATGAAIGGHGAPLGQAGRRGAKPVAGSVARSVRDRPARRLRAGRRRRTAVDLLRDRRGHRRRALGLPTLRARPRCSWACSRSRSCSAPRWR